MNAARHGELVADVMPNEYPPLHISYLDPPMHNVHITLTKINNSPDVLLVHTVSEDHRPRVSC